MRRIVRLAAFALALSAFALVLAGLAAAATRDVDLPRLFAKQIRSAKEHTGVPVRLPQKLPSDFSHHYPEGEAHSGRWTFDIGAVRNCHLATACFIAQFRGVRGGRPGNVRKVTLVGGRTGYFRPLSCGASCSPPSIEWRQHGVLYTIQANVGGKRTERRILVRMADSAIRHGPR
jgi:hypothetical protein